MVGYKLVRKRRNGTLASLFIGASNTLALYEWLEAECIPTKGYAVRKGWHCCSNPYAPHLSTKGRVWVVVLMQDYETLERPESQGGTWLIAKKMMILGEM